MGQIQVSLSHRQQNALKWRQCEEWQWGKIKCSFNNLRSRSSNYVLSVTLFVIVIKTIYQSIVSTCVFELSVCLSLMVWMRMSQHWLRMLSSLWVLLFRRLGRCGLDGGSASPWLGFECSRTQFAESLLRHNSQFALCFLLLVSYMSSQPSDLAATQICCHASPPWWQQTDIPLEP